MRCMKSSRNSRRAFFKYSALWGLGTVWGPSLRACPEDEISDWSAMIKAPILRKSLIPTPCVIHSIELLQLAGQYLVRVRTTDGAEGLAAANPMTMQLCYPIFLQRVVPVFVGKDAREWEVLQEELYVHQSNYKWQGLPFWSSVAALEFAVLDLLGKVAQLPVGQLLGEVRRKDIAVYHASSHRGNSPEEEIDHLQKLVDRIGNKAIKFRLGARMRYDEASTRRDEALIPLARKVFGEDAVLYADANGSYDVPKAIEIGRLLQDHDYGFFEEPCPFDAYTQTQQVAEKLTIPIAGGEQEPSIRQFAWMASRGVLRVLQPDLVYFGGMIRSLRVAKMAERAAIPCTPHMSGYGMGFLYVLHFASCVSDPGPFQEYKGASELPIYSDSSTLAPISGLITCPSGPGWGVVIDPDAVSKAVIIRG